MGWVTITHPFHPFGGQRFSVLKRRRVSGVETLIIRHPERGSMAVALEWTDWATPTTRSVVPDAILAMDALVDLAALVDRLDHPQGGLDE